MFTVLDFTKDDVIAIHAEGKITKNDYEKLNPLIDKTVRENDHVKLFVELDEVETIKPEAFVKDVKMYLKNFNKIEKVAVTGDSSWQKIISGISSPFVSGKVKYFPKNQLIEAQSWIQH